MSRHRQFVAWLSVALLASVALTQCLIHNRSAPGQAAPSAGTIEPRLESHPVTADRSDADTAPERADAIERSDEPSLVDCPPLLPELTDAQIEALEARNNLAREQVASTLRAVDDPALRLAATLLGADSFPDQELLRDLHELAQHDALALHALLGECTGALTDVHCADAGLSALIEEVDGDNSEAWAMLAARRLELGDEDAAADALMRANGSPVTTTYFADYVRLFNQAYVSATGLDISERAVAAIGHAAGQQLAGMTALLRHCHARSADSVGWRRLCVEYARQLRARESTALQQSVATHLLARLAEYDGDYATAARLREEADAERTERLRFAERFGRVLETITFDEQLMAEYLDELLVHGEQRAQALLDEQVARFAHCVGPETADY